VRFASDEELVERFVAAGLSADRAQWILRRTEELRLEALQAQYDAARGVATDATASLPRLNVLREELGDADYERYLQAQGRPTSVSVGDVLARSPAEQAGLQSGDELVAYAGSRVFDMGDLNRLVLEGEPGQMVAVDVVREGQTVQLYLPRGPIGITGGRGGRRLR
jgi:S1-C subfamily serine protease